jgi:transcriptional regulator with XRE-family HTH domain
MGEGDRGPYARDQEVFRVLLRQVRLEAGLRQQDLAARLGVPQSLISRAETGERRLDVIELRRICQALGVPLPEFVARLETALNES